jgi:16S rRNA (cytosine967-C5)-methyltransferase
MRSHSYLNSAKKIISSYDGGMPLAAWLKQYFKQEKKFGSKDRKHVAHLCYCYYRLGNAFKQKELEEKLLTSVFLCSEEDNFVLRELRPEWNDNVTLQVEEKIKLLHAEDERQNIFPFNDELNPEINASAFNLSFLIQPDVYLRIRPGKKERVLEALRKEKISFSLPDENCIQLASQARVDEILHIDSDVVIQDYNSQKTLGLFANCQLATASSTPQTPNPKLVWDCCAASGGKSILLHDLFPSTRITVSDVRKSILINLEKRFEKAGIKNYNSFVADISSPRFSSKNRFDLVICDAPCSGSGTWSRTPEQLAFFKKEKVDYYADLQKRIVANAAKSVMENGYLVYITCSVFTNENEKVVEFIQSDLHMHLCASQYLKGYERRADTLFVALFRRTR